MRIIATACFLALFASTAASGTTYFISQSGGSDSNSGTSSGSPWQTVAKVNATIFAPGGVVQFNRGDTWHEKLIVPSAGTSGNRITFGCYGSGAAPILEEDSTRHPAITVSGQDNITLSCLQVQNTNGDAIDILGSQNVTVSGLAIVNPTAHGIFANGASNGLVISTNTLTLGGGNTMTGSFVDVNSASMSAVAITGNTATLNANGNNNGIFVIDVQNASISLNTITGATIGIAVNASTHNVTGAQVFRNQVIDARDTHGDGEAIEFTGTASFSVSGSAFQNFVHGGANSTSGIDGVFTNTVAIYNNISIGTFSGSPYHWSSNCLNTTFFNNTGYGGLYGFLVDSGSTAVIKNNVVVSASSHAIAVGSGATATEDYNDFYSSGANGGAGTLTAGGHSITTNPSLTTSPPVAAIDVKLLSGSGAIDAATSVGAPAVDYAGTARPQGSAVDMGAYETGTAGTSSNLQFKGKVKLRGKLKATR